MKLTGLLALAVALSLTRTSSAQVCDGGDVQTNLQYLRRLSLDLRGRLPSIEELRSVVSTGSVDPALIDEMIGSEELVEQMRAYHRDLLWTNVLDRRIARNTFNLRSPAQRTGGPAYFVPAAGRAILYRGAQVPCLDEPARFGTDGAILTTQDPANPSIRREGWVEVVPYWDRNTTVRVCAFDAQDNLTAPDAQGRQVDCSRQTNARGCGCGPNLRFCQSPADGTVRTILSSLNEQLLRFADDVVRSDRPYTDFLLAKDMEVNGPISYWLRFQTGAAGNLLFAGAQQNYDIPARPFDAPAWVSVDRGIRHAGVLSMPGYLVKFQSNRGRANRFYNAFLCQYFEARNPLPPATDSCHLEPDLTKRCGCKDCHIALEPAAGHWGRWAEAGLMPLERPGYPKMNQTCAEVTGRGGPAICQFYFTPRDMTDESERPFLGLLKPYVFATAETERNIEEGPERIATAAIDSGAFASCTVRKMWSRFLSREPTFAESELMDELAADFSTDYSLKRLIRTIVTRPEYIAE